MSGSRSSGVRLALGLAIVAALVAAFAFWRLRPPTPPILPTLAEREEERLLAELRPLPAFADEIEGLPPAETRRAIREFALRGMRRLDDESLVARAVLVDVMLRELDPETCGAVVQGTLPPEQQEQAEARLGRSEKSAWLALIYKAARAELEKAELPPSNPAAVRAALHELVSHVPPEDVPRLETSLPRLREVAPAEACWAGRAIYAQVPTLRPPHDGVLARVLAKP